MERRGRKESVILDSAKAAWRCNVISTGIWTTGVLKTARDANIYAWGVWARYLEQDFWFSDIKSPNKSLLCVMKKKVTLEFLSSNIWSSQITVSFSPSTSSDLVKWRNLANKTGVGADKSERWGRRRSQAHNLSPSEAVQRWEREV